MESAVFVQKLVFNELREMMEVRGSVLLRDVSDPPNTSNIPQEVNIWAMTPAKIEQMKSDGVPRIAVRGYRKKAKWWPLYSFFSKFGTITYFGMLEHYSIIEYENRECVNRIMGASRHLRFGPSFLDILKLPSFPHTEPVQLEFCIDSEVADALKSPAYFEKYVENLRENARLQANPDRDLEVCQALERCLRTQYPDCKAYPHGSRVSGTTVPPCDLDIFLDTGDMYDGNFEQDPASQQILLSHTYKVLSKDCDYKNLDPVPKARVPILRYLHVPTGTHCDVAFKNGLGVENAKLMRFFISLDSRFHPLCVFLKQWAHLHGMRQIFRIGQFSSYGLIMMLVYYLQQLPEPVLPCISELQELCEGPRHIVAGWDCSFIKDKSKIPRTKNTQTVLQLFEGFCDFFRSFDFDHYVICPLWGTRLEKEQFDAELDVTRFLVRRDTREICKFSHKCPISVQDPFDLSHNLTGSVKPQYLMKFVSICGLTYSLCASLH